MENHNYQHKKPHPSERISPSSVYYCPMECEGEKVYFQQGKRCPVCNMFLVPIEEKLEKDPNYKPKYSATNLPENFKDHIGEFYCPMFCEGDKIYPEKTDCPVCNMQMEKITEDLVANGMSNAGSHHSTKAETQELKPETNNAGKYYCPMFCEGDKVYDSNVGCPVCGMDLVKYPDKNGDDSDDTFEILKKKLLISLAITIPVFILSMGGNGD